MMREPGASSIHFDTANKTVKKAVVRLDPEERNHSAIKIGLDDSTRTSNEDLAVLTPLVADAFRTLAGNPNTSILGEFQAKYNRAEDRLFDRQIKVVNIGEQTPDGDMTPRMFYETFLHELGHAIESQSGFRSFVELMSKRLTLTLMAQHLQQSFIVILKQSAGTDAQNCGLTRCESIFLGTANW